MASDERDALADRASGARLMADKAVTPIPVRRMNSRRVDFDMAFGDALIVFPRSPEPQGESTASPSALFISVFTFAGSGEVKKRLVTQLVFH